MATGFRSSYADYAELIATRAIIKGESYYNPTLLDLTTKQGAWILAAIGRGSATAFTAGKEPQLVILPTDDEDTLVAPAGVYCRRASAVTPWSCLANGAQAAAVSTVIDGVSGSPLDDDLVFCWSTTSVPVASGTWAGCTTSEFLWIADYASTLLKWTHICKQAKADNEVIVGKADFWHFWLPGGQKFQVGFDYQSDHGGSAAAIGVMFQYKTHDHMLNVAV